MENKTINIKLEKEEFTFPVAASMLYHAANRLGVMFGGDFWVFTGVNKVYRTPSGTNYTAEDWTVFSNSSPARVIVEHL